MFLFGTLLMFMGLFLFISGTVLADSLPTYGWLDPSTMITVAISLMGLLVTALGCHIIYVDNNLRGDSNDR